MAGTRRSRSPVKGQRQGSAGNRRLRVSIAFDGPPELVGELALRDGRIYFAYASEWLRTGVPIAPDLPLRDGLFEGRREPFDGLHGIFADSLPDGWGRLLLDRTVRQAGIAPETQPRLIGSPMSVTARWER